MAHRDLKERLYPQFARVAQALASDRRLELVDLLAQAPRHVEALAAETDMSVANVSQHLQVLRAARLVETRRQGTKVIYSLAGPDVLRLWLALRTVAADRLAEVEALKRQFMPLEPAEHTVSLRELERWLGESGAVLLDVRPREEFRAGHLPGAVSMPPDEIAERLNDLPEGRPVVAYCRGEYCLFAEEAVALLRERGFDAWRLDGGWIEWNAAGLEISDGCGPG